MLSDNKLIDADRIKSLKIDINRLLKEEINIRSIRQELERELRSILISIYTENSREEIPVS